MGRATARAFAHKGFHVALLARGPERLDAARREVEGAGVRALAVPVDVADTAAVDEAAARVEDELGPIDVWVNVAMTSILAQVKDTKPEEYASWR